jgi:hypothetical protein
MAWFGAGEHGVNMRHLWELGKLSDWDNIRAPNTRTGVNDFRATLRGDGIEYHFWGENLTLKHGRPHGGKLTTITVVDAESTEELYQASSQSIRFRPETLHRAFSGAFEKSLFDGNDRIYGSGADDILVGYGGDDKFHGGGGNDDIRGKEDHDEIKGNTGDDVINGNKGNDKIYGDEGNDVLTGGGGKDRFRFSTDLDPATNIDTVTDFTRGKDVMVLANFVFPGLGSHGALAADKFVRFSRPDHPEEVIVYKKATGDLYYDPDGGGGAALIQFARVTPGLALSADDFIV